MALPEGTVTFLRSDIEGSMEHVRALGARYDELNAEHAALVRAAVNEHGGQVVRTEGDAFFTVFTQARAAAHTAVGIQLAMAAHDWPDGHPLRVRIGIHTGEAVRAGDDYGGFEVNRAARIAAAGHGGQIILSDSARALIAADSPDDWTVRDLGRYRLKGVVEPERLFQLDAPGLAAEFGPLRGPTRAAAHLPERHSSLIGRETDLGALSRLLEETRLLTLTGPGGTGKTTLALELARRQAGDHIDGTWFVDLQAISEPERVQGEIARAVGLRDGSTGPASDRLLDYVSELELLIVVDNFEQVIEAADVVAALVEASPRSRVIVTSRIPLRLAAEQEYPVAPLLVQADKTAVEPDAVRLFVDRIRRVRPDIDPRDDIPAIHDICRLLDGLPLAIELAAARGSVLPIRTIQDRLQRRLPLPGGGQRDLPARQRTIEDTVAWSVDLLEAPLRSLLTRLSIFEESFELEQAEAVSGAADELGIDVLEGTYSLAEQSLLMRVDDAVGGLRFTMLETIRAFAAQRLREQGDEVRIRSRHADAYAALVGRLPGDPFGPDRPAVLDRLDADDANLRAATAWAIEQGQVEQALSLVGDLWRHWLGNGRLRDGVTLAEGAIALPFESAHRAARAQALDGAGGLFYWVGDLERADACYHEQLELGRQLGEPRLEAEALFNLAYTRNLLGDAASAQDAAEGAIDRFTALGDRPMALRVDLARTFAISSGDPLSEERLASLLRIVEQLEDLDDRWARLSALTARAQIHLIRGEAAEALRIIPEAFQGAVALRDFVDISMALPGVAMALISMDRVDAAATILGASEGASERLGFVPPASLAQLTGMDDPESIFIDALGAERLADLRAAGRRMPLEETFELIARLAPEESPSSPSS